MNPSLAREAKELAARSGKSFTAVVEQAVRELLARQQTAAKPRPYVPLPTCGDPSKKITWEQYQKMVEQVQREDDLKALGMTPNDASRRQRPRKRLSA